jgi:hypothetical protein
MTSLTGSVGCRRRVAWRPLSNQCLLELAKPQVRHLLGDPRPYCSAYRTELLLSNGDHQCLYMACKTLAYALPSVTEPDTNGHHHPGPEWPSGIYHNPEMAPPSSLVEQGLAQEDPL